jgi:DNA-directed RNA polymerase II subunit RPB1
MRGVSANVMCGQQGYFGTSSFQVLADINALMQHEATEDMDDEDGDKIIDGAFEGASGQGDKCSINNLTIDSNTMNIKEVDLGGGDDDYDIEF